MIAFFLLALAPGRAARGEDGPLAKAEEWIRLGRLDKARAELRRVAKENASSAVAIDAALREIDLEVDGAVCLADLEALAHSTGSGKVRFALGKYRYAVGAYAAAASDFAAAAHGFDGVDRLEARFWEGASLLAAGESREGLDRLAALAGSAAGESVPSDRARFLAAQIYGARGEPKECLALIAPLAEGKGDFALPSLLLEARSRIALGDTALGREKLDELITLSPRSAEAAAAREERLALLASEATPRDAGEGWYVQIGLFTGVENAKRFLALRRREGVGAIEIYRENRDGTDVFPVRIGPFREENQARAAVENLARRGIEGTPVHVGSPEEGAGDAKARLTGPVGESEATMAPKTPMMRQYREIKAKHPDAILFFRLGDFYEMFFDDAVTASRVLGLTLTSRGKDGGEPIPLAGVPWHKAEHYVDRLLKAGYRVAVCDQMEDPRKAKGLVKREVTEVVTPGTALGGATLENKEANYLLALRVNGERAGLAAIDVTTGDFRLGEFPIDELAEEVSRFCPAEVIVPRGVCDNTLFEHLDKVPALTELEEWRFDPEEGERLLKTHFRVETLDGFGCSAFPLGIAAAGVLLGYLRDLGRDDLSHVDRLSLIDNEKHLVLDETTRRNLELFRPLREGPVKTTLLSVIDETVTAMGGRLLREWMMRPLRVVMEIDDRLDAVGEAAERGAWRAECRENLARFADIERLAGKLVLGRGSPRDLTALKETLRLVPDLAGRTAGARSRLFARLAAGIDPLTPLADLIHEAIVDSPPAMVRDGGVIRPGYHEELDELRGIGNSGQEWIIEFQRRERERTGIPTLKVAFNKVFGYYIEISRAKSKDVPPTYVRKQTLVNAERFITPELKEQEDRILGAEERIREMEEELFLEVRRAAASEAVRLRRTGENAAAIDVLFALGEAAAKRRYCRPKVNDGTRTVIRGGRHPVVETILPPGNFIPNDTRIDCDESQIHLITGPNMAGKSTYLRQVALIQYLAQLGSWVSADSAELGVADRIFTRVGASDDLARGQSTFLVEMTETANILHNATNRSLILLDEIGRGTSTLDGVSIAWAVVEFLHKESSIAARTLFATHYHELADLADRLERVRNFSVRVKEWNDKVVFLRRIVPGSVDRSYGIQVARLAGLPNEVIRRAKQVLRHLEKEHGNAPLRISSVGDTPQIDMFQREREEILEEIVNLVPEELTPLEALRKLTELKRRIAGTDEGR